MRSFIKIPFLIFLGLFISCEVGKVTEEAENLLADELPEEFFKLLIDGTEVVIHDDPTKASGGRGLAAETYNWYDGFDRKSALKFWGTREGEAGQELEKIGGYIKDYWGPGIYITGTDYNKNFCHYLFHGKSYYSASYEGETGFIEITKDADGWLTGNFDYRAYNLNNPADSKKIIGIFKVMKVASLD